MEIIATQWRALGSRTVKRYTLHIRGAQFLSKDRPPVRVNLHTLTLESDYPEDVVYLKLSHDRTVRLPQPLDIPIN